MSVHFVDVIRAAGALHDAAIRVKGLPPDWMNIEALKATLARLAAHGQRADST
jgi:hypothetical protein